MLGRRLMFWGSVPLIKLLVKSAVVIDCYRDWLKCQIWEKLLVERALTYYVLKYRLHKKKHTPKHTHWDRLSFENFREYDQWSREKRGTTLSIENHWMDKANPLSRCRKGNSLSNTYTQNKRRVVIALVAFPDPPFLLLWLGVTWCFLSVGQGISFVVPWPWIHLVHSMIFIESVGPTTWQLDIPAK